MPPYLLVLLGKGNFTFLPRNRGVTNGRSTFCHQGPSSEDRYVPPGFNSRLQRPNVLLPTASNTAS